MTAAAMDVTLGKGTRGKIIEELSVAPRTARDLAKKLGIQESAARGHLDRLEERGLVIPTFRREGVGRPRKRYLLSPQGQELFPRRYEMLLDSVVETILTREGEGYASALFADAARRMASQIAQKIPADAPTVDRAKALANALNELGFRSTVQESPTGELKIVRTNCVFRHSALTHAYLVCDVFDKHLTEALIGQVGVHLRDSISRGGMQCTHLIQLE